MDKQENKYEDVLNCQVREVGESHRGIVCFKDGGVVSVYYGTIELLAKTTQSENFIENLLKKTKREQKRELSMLKRQKERVAISKTETITLEKNTGVGSDKKLFWGDKYILSNGLVIFADDKGISVHTSEKDFNNLLREKTDLTKAHARYYDFIEFYDKAVNAFDESAQKEFKKYTIRQATGNGLINPHNIVPEMMDYKSFAGVVGSINRFAGQTVKLYGSKNEFYTVGQHCLAGYNYIKDHPNYDKYNNLSDKEKKLFPLWEDLCFLSKEQKQTLADNFANHELYECITGVDMPSPHKTKDNDYVRAEKKAEEVGGLIQGSPLMTPLLKKVDKLMASIEGELLLGSKHHDWGGGSIDESFRKLLYMVDNNREDVLQLVKKELASIWEKKGGIVEKTNAFIEDRKLLREDTLHFKMKNTKILEMLHPFKLEENTKVNISKALSHLDTDNLEIEEGLFKASLSGNSDLKITPDGQVLSGEKLVDLNIFKKEVEEIVELIKDSSLEIESLPSWDEHKAVSKKASPFIR